MAEKLDFHDVRFVIVDDQPVCASGLQSLLQDSFSGCSVFIAYGAKQGMEIAQQGGDWRTTLVLLDLMMPGREGMLFLEQVRNSVPATPVKTVILSGVACPHRIAECRRAGADGYLLKTESVDDQLSEIARGIDGQFRFSEGEQEDVSPAIAALTKLPPSLLKVYNLVCEGKTNQGIADVLGLSLSTVKQYNSKLMSMLGMSSRAEMIAISRRSNSAVTPQSFFKET